jgi:regulator of nucleoside diphosphate kinase
MNMSYEAIVTDADKQRVMDRIRLARGSWTTYAPLLDWFRAGLDEVRGVPPADVPDDVITMNSRFAVMDMRSGETISYTLVYPEEESLERGKLCVLSPMGMALLGARAGDVVHWNGASGPGSAEVLRLLYQPEAAGDHNL